jgi:hypothetical protein
VYAVGGKRLMTDYATYLNDDFELRDDLQLVTLINAVTHVAVANIRAKNRNLSYREVTLGGSLGLEPTDQVLMLGCKRLGSVVPSRGDTITCTDGTVWTILSNVMNSFGDTPVLYEVIVRRQ